MTDYNEEMSKILGIYNLPKFLELIEDIYEIVHLYNVDESDDWVKDVVGNDSVRDIRLCRTAFLLSKLAHRHADSLKHVKRKAPGFWQRAEKLTKQLDNKKISDNL
jgi:hypothetical protein